MAATAAASGPIRAITLFRPRRDSNPGRSVPVGAALTTVLTGRLARTRRRRRRRRGEVLASRIGDVDGGDGNRSQDVPLKSSVNGHRAAGVTSTSAEGTAEGVEGIDWNVVPDIYTDVVGLVGVFDVDDALSAWIFLRFAFIWVVFGYLTVPVLASVQGLSPPSTLPPAQLGAALVCSECCKLSATALMLRAELGDAGKLHTAAPWLRYTHRHLPAASLASAAPPPLRNQVAAGAGFGVAASIAARALDAITHDGAAREAPKPGLLDLLSTAASTDGGDGTGLGASFVSAHAPAVALALSSLLVAPALEELFFRGYVLPAVGRRVPAAAAVAATAFAFSAMHFDPDAAPGLFAVGCAFGAASVVTDGGLVAPTVAHATYNAGVLLEAALSSWRVL